MKRSSIGRLLAVAGCSLLLVASAKVARADSLSFSLTDNAQTGCNTATLCAGPFGTVTLTTSGSNVDVTETLNSAYYFINTGKGVGASLDFNTTGAVTSISPSSYFTLDPNSPVKGSAFGSFTQGISCTGCGKGASQVPNTPQSLSFVVDGVTLQSFTANADGVYFASDVADYNSETGKVIATGDVGSSMGGTPVVPEPNSLLLFGTGMALLLVTSKHLSV